MSLSETHIVVGIVEDEPVQAELYATMLQAAGMRVESYRNALDFQRRQGINSIDVLLLDWNLPEMSGIELLRELRAQSYSHVPIILLTANGTEEDVVYGLRSGADDYVVKPPRALELSARISNAYRRIHREVTAIIDAEPFSFDVANRDLRVRGELYSATEKEFDLLVYLFRRTERIVSRQMLLRDVWKLGPSVNTRSVDTYISRVRKSLGLNGDSGWLLEGVYQHGYRLSKVSAVDA